MFARRKEGPVLQVRLGSTECWLGPYGRTSMTRVDHDRVMVRFTQAMKQFGYVHVTYTRTFDPVPGEPTPPAEDDARPEPESRFAAMMRRLFG
jgi:hypothetical protein